MTGRYKNIIAYLKNKVLGFGFSLVCEKSESTQKTSKLSVANDVDSNHELRYSEIL